MIKLKTNDQFKFGQVNVLPYLGETQISKNGVIEVEDQQIADNLVGLEIGFFYLLEETTTTTTTELLPLVTVGTTTSPVEDDRTLLLKTLDMLKVDELRQYAEPFPKEEWEKLKKGELIEYLKSKL